MAHGETRGLSEALAEQRPGTAETIFTNARLVLEDEVVRGSLAMANGAIAGLDAGGVRNPAAVDLDQDRVALAVGGGVVGAALERAGRVEPQAFELHQRALVLLRVRQELLERQLGRLGQRVVLREHLFGRLAHLLYGGCHASQLALDAEIVAFARESDVDPRPLNEFLGMDISERLFKADYSQDVEGLGGLAIWDKDLGYALDVAREDDIAMPLTSLVHETYKHGHRVAREEEGDATTIARYWAALNGR